MNIYALSSGRGPSGIAIIRLSGDKAIEIAKIITKKTNLKSRQINFCKFFNPKNNKMIDEGILLLFPAPNSFTGQNIAEFHIHGSNAVIKEFLNVLALQKNSRLADPGEFTKLAFQNNKVDLVEAESIGDLINAETEMQRQQALKMIQGNASQHYNNLREKLIKSLAHVEAKIDFGEEDISQNVIQNAKKEILEVYQEIKEILEDQKVGEKIREGFKVSIVGQVNAGKSSLLNLLSKREAAIVSEEEGTTRDVIETYLDIGGYPVILSDTAGIREAKNEVERKGISLAISKSINSDLNIVMIDNTTDKVEKKILDIINSNSIVVLNKSDITNNKSTKYNEIGAILISVKQNKNIDNLIKAIKEKLNKKFINNGNILVTRQRHRDKLKACLNEIEKFQRKNTSKEIELAAEDLRMATRHLASIIGRVDVEEILGSIFKDFCIGK
ncbi:MAG: tRNA modification GTPase [Pelagibacterales bacterium]|nr:tRNA modification GTPase [Pelagibacterales bacterium]